MRYSEELVEFIKAWEGFKAIPSPDPLVPTVWDVGYGTTISEWDAIEIRRTGGVTKHKAEEMLRERLDGFAEGVESMVHVKLDQHQFDALVSFAYNVGLDQDEDDKPEGLGDSTLLACVNAGRWDAAALQFPLWCHANGKKVPGLEKRRIAELAMWRYSDYSGRP